MASVQADLRLQIIFDTHFFDQAELCFKPIDVFFFRLQDRVKKITANVVLVCLAIRNCCLKIGDSVQLDVEIALEHFGNMFTDA